MKMPAESALHLLHEARHATLATQSTRLPGYPFATAVPCVVDETHCPLLFISALAEHTRNLIADPRVSLSVVEPGMPDVQQAARVTVVGDAEPVSPDPALVARYLRYQPDAETLLGLDFQFFRIRPLRLRCIEGVGRAGWIEADAWSAVPAVSLADEAALLRELAAAAPSGTRLLGIDRFGLDCEIRGRFVRRRFAVIAEAHELAAAARTALASGAQSMQ